MTITLTGFMIWYSMGLILTLLVTLSIKTLKNTSMHLTDYINIAILALSGPFAILGLIFIGFML